MAAAPADPQRRRPRRGSLERPINGRLYRGTWLLVALPVLLAAFSVTRAAPLAASTTPPAFDATAAVGLADELSTNYPNRVPGTSGALGAAQWFREQLQPYGFRVDTEAFTATIPGHGHVLLRNLIASRSGRSPREIVVMAHRDDSGAGPGAVDNASGTAALIELARAYAIQPATAAGQRAKPITPSFTLVFLSTDGGAFGSVGAAEFAAHSRYRNNIEAVINLDGLGGSDQPRLEFAADRPHSPAATLLATTSALVQQQTGQAPSRPSFLRQLIDLGFPFSPYEQAPFIARGIPAVTLTAMPDRPFEGLQDVPKRIDATRLGQLGIAAQQTLGALDQGLDLSQGTASFVLVGDRVIPGWAIELVLIGALLPFFAAVVDLFARCRRRRIPIAPALRSYRSRLAFWLWTGGLFMLFAFTGVWPRGVARPPALDSSVAHHWASGGLAGLAILSGLGWLVARDRLSPRRETRPEEELAGYTGGLLALSVVALLVVATNPFALVFLLPCLHLWLWLPQIGTHGRTAKAALLVAGFLGPGLLLASFAFRYGLGWDAPWYVAELFALGYAPLPPFIVALAWLAGTAQLTALVAGRYAAYPSARERRPRGPLRELVRTAILAERARRQRRATRESSRALEG